MIRWRLVYGHHWFRMGSALVMDGLGHGGTLRRKSTEAHINATHTLGRLLEAIR